MAKKPKHLLQTSQSRAIIGIALLVIVYLLGSRALDTGSLQQYALTIVLFVISIQQIIRAVRSN